MQQRRNAWEDQKGQEEIHIEGTSAIELTEKD